MVLDLAHSAPQVVEDVLAMTDIPLVVSHGGFAGYCDVKRNIPVDLMRRIAEGGGVVGMGYWADVTCGDAGPTNVAEMIAAAVAELGEDAVSLGSDFDGSVATAFDISELPALTQALMDQGLSEAQIAKVMGGNMERLLRAPPAGLSARTSPKRERPPRGAAFFREWEGSRAKGPKRADPRLRATGSGLGHHPLLGGQLAHPALQLLEGAHPRSGGSVRG